MKEYSPVEPEIMAACDMSVSVKQAPADRSANRSKRQNVKPLVAHNSSIKRKRVEMKLSGPARQAKIDFLKKHNCAKKIQRNFRVYLQR